MEPAGESAESLQERRESLEKKLKKLNDERTVKEIELEQAV